MKIKCCNSSFWKLLYLWSVLQQHPFLAMELTYFCPNYIHTDVILKATIQQLSTMWAHSQPSSCNAWENACCILMDDTNMEFCTIKGEARTKAIRHWQYLTATCKYGNIHLHTLCGAGCGLSIWIHLPEYLRNIFCIFSQPSSKQACD